MGAIALRLVAWSDFVATTMALRVTAREWLMMRLEGAELRAWQEQHLWPYCLALGHFVHVFAKLEMALQIVLWAESGLDPLRGRALFSGVKVDQAVSLIRRLHEAQGRQLSPFYNYVLPQVSAINAERNRILHYGAHAQDDGTLVVSNQRAAHIPERNVSTVVSTETLSCMRDDVVTIVQVLTHIRHQLAGTSFTEGEELIGAAWKFKPVPVRAGSKGSSAPQAGKT